MKIGGWLTGLEIAKQVETGGIMIYPFNFDQLNPNSYNYGLSPILKRNIDDIIDLKAKDNYEIIRIPEEGYILEPGECYLGSTNEIFGSDEFASLVTGRSSIGRKFITNHITAGLIDQGFFGNITLEIVAMKKTRVYPNIRFGQIFWYTTYGDPYLYKGKYQGQDSPEESKIYMDFDGDKL